MMSYSNFAEKLNKVKELLEKENLDGWLLYDFKRSNDLACDFLELPKTTFLTRRFFYWIPKNGKPIKLNHAIEDFVLNHLPGEKRIYTTWQQLHEQLQNILKSQKKIVMEYSPNSAIPTISKVDGGTLELVKSFGCDVLSSADLLQHFTSVLDDEQLKSHLKAAFFLDQTVEKAFQFIEKNLGKVTEYDVQQFILNEFSNNGFISDSPPICAINENSANPHYSPSKNSKIIQANDFILLDLWCRENKPKAIYADITRVGVAAKKPTEKQQQIFDIVRQAQKKATEFVKKAFLEKRPIKGFEVDECCRNIIEKAGFGKFFIHRTGHNIYENDHGYGTNIDSYETKDTRSILPGTCFSIEPGIYLPNEFGIRLEYDLYIHLDGKVEIAGGIQESIRTM